MQRQTISLIIPAYNEEMYIEGCLLSIKENARGKLFEIIVVNNGSTDRTKTIVEKIPDVIIIDEFRKGLSFAREAGRRRARGSIIAYIDADTHMPAGWIDILEKEFATDQNMVCLSGPYRYYDSPIFFKFLITLYWYLLALPTYYIVGYMTVGGNFAIRKDILEKMGGFDTSILFYGEDTNIARRARVFGKVKFMLHFFMNTSARRLSKQGYFKTGLVYMSNFLTEVFFHKPFTKKYKDYR